MYNKQTTTPSRIYGVKIEKNYFCIFCAISGASSTSKEIIGGFQTPDAASTTSRRQSNKIANEFPLMMKNVKLPTMNE